MAVGAALAGYRPVVELYMAEFMLVAMDQVVNEAPRLRYMTDGQVTVPLVLESVAKTGRLVLVDQATRHGSAAAVIAAEVAEAGFGSLRAPVKLVTALDATIPYSQPMEAYVLPDEDKIVAAVREVLGLTAAEPVGG